MAYIGKSIESGTFSVLDTSGNTYNGSNTTFNLGTQVGSVAQLLVSHDGVIQKPGTDYTLASGGTQITFTTAPASGASIFIVEISGAVGGPLDADLNGTELILDADGDTSLHASTDDQIDIKIAGADDFSFTANTFTAASGSTIAAQALTATTLTATGAVSLNGGSFVFNEDSADVDFRIEGNGDANLMIVDGGTDNVSFSRGSAATDQAIVHISRGGYNPGSNGKHALMVGADIGDANTLTNSTRKLGSIVAPHYTNAEEPITIARLDSDNGSSQLMFGGTSETNSTEEIIFRTATDDANKSTGAERMSIQKNGYVNIGTAVDGVYNDSSGAGGFNFNPTSTVALAVNGARPLMLNRIGDGGTIVEFYQGGGFVGSISESAGTVSYNAFAGSHWSRLADNSKPTILRGTVMESISTLCNWHQVEFTVTIDEENVIKKESIALPSGKSVGDIIKHTYQGVEYDAKILKEDNERLPMCKISDTEDSKAVYGVFMTWDNDPDDGVNDMLVTALGAFVVRIHKDETVAIGDYLQSKGDGTAKKQADDILRASTIAKVTSTEKTHTYSDGSYCVPCTLHCG